ncbi:alkyl/aryl-sulfatase [Pseudoxanthomonas suwonensis]|uniref:alkyl/aryl-sulfatase n=1 Tax=Pseudoxanthomonas suwonensis TaxID=314722 RepID=UPI0009E3B560|nr:alkyl sulfatase dimerization domain-containing protein [Pseudoxanthomonas suwonensis]
MRSLLSKTFSIAVASAIGLAAPSAIAAGQASADGHFHPEGKPASRFTVELRNGVKKALPFEDVRDFEENERGLIAVPPFKQIMADAGHVAWDMESYSFLLQGKDFDSINPSLQRQAILNMAYGLYEVLPGRIYQVRGFDLANITFIKGDTGWIVFDPATAAETARAALKFVNEKLGERPVVAVVYSHSHMDHFGGVHGVVDEADVRSGKVKIIAPEGFLHEAISENVFAGTAMARRGRVQYGLLLARSEHGHVDQSIGKNVANGNTGLIAPTVDITEDFQELTVDGVRMVFQNTPDTEAPASMNTWFPDWKAFWAAEVVTGTIHNIYTLRGAPVRNSLNWSKQINAAIHNFQGVEVLFASHSWPRWGNARILEVLRAQRDLYANMNNGALRLANMGVTVNEVHNVYRSPPSLQRQWAARSYHGSEAINSRAIINRFIGFWDGNPVNLEPLPQTESGRLYVEMMGGSARILAKGRELIDQGKYLHAGEILNRLVFAEPSNQAARNLLADAFEQLGYQRESPSLRNTYLNMAYELRSGMQEGVMQSSSSPDVIRAMATDQWLDFLGISVDSAKAEGMRFTINLVTPDNGEKFLIEMSNATLTNIKGFTAADADLTITLDRSELDRIMMGTSSFEALEREGKVRFAGDRRPLAQLAGTLTQFTPDFEVFPGTRNARPAPAPAKPFQVVLQPVTTFVD